MRHKRAGILSPLTPPTLMPPILTSPATWTATKLIIAATIKPLMKEAKVEAPSALSPLKMATKEIRATKIRRIASIKNSWFV